MSSTDCAVLQTEAVDTYVVRIIPKAQLRAISTPDRLQWLAEHKGNAEQQASEVAHRCPFACV